MDSSYTACVTDNPTYILSIAIDGHAKRVVDYVGSWEGMPAVIAELEDKVRRLHTQRWIEGDQGLVTALQAENFNFQSFEAQVMLKEAALRGRSETVRDFLRVRVPLEPLPAPKPKEPYMTVRFDGVGWLNAASNNPEALQVLIDAGTSKNDQPDKDLALAGDARSGNVDAVRRLIAYGANPNADLSKLILTERSRGMTMQGTGDSALIYAAESGNPDMVREILGFHPNLEARDHEGKNRPVCCRRVSGVR
jgi:Ankyrin repeats (3 copies)